MEKQNKTLRDKIEGINSKNHRDFSSIVNLDELFQKMAADQIFKNFIEPPINFPPTYKYNINNSTYDESRLPSYCVRIINNT